MNGGQHHVVDEALVNGILICGFLLSIETIGLRDDAFPHNFLPVIVQVSATAKGMATAVVATSTPSGSQTISYVRMSLS